MVASLGGVGALVGTRKPREPVGWILLASASMVTLAVAGEDYVQAQRHGLRGGAPASPSRLAWLDEPGLRSRDHPPRRSHAALLSGRAAPVAPLALGGVDRGVRNHRGDPAAGVRPGLTREHPRLTIHSGSRAVHDLDGLLGSRECPAGGRGPAAGDRLDHPQVPARIPTIREQLKWFGAVALMTVAGFIAGPSGSHRSAPWAVSSGSWASSSSRSPWASPSFATGSTTSTGSSAGRSRTARSPGSWRSCSSEQFLACRPFSRRSTAAARSRSRRPHSSWPRSFNRCAGVSSRSSMALQPLAL